MSYVRSLYHIVFRTRRSEPTLYLPNTDMLYRYIWGFCKEKQCTLLRINGMEEHVHLLIRLHPNIALAAFVRDLKVATHSWMNKNKNFFPRFDGWANGYAALSYAHGEQKSVMEYIANQREHHKRTNFKEEFRKFLTENNIPIDEKYFLKD